LVEFGPLGAGGGGWAEGADGVVAQVRQAESSIQNHHPVRSILRMLREIFLMSRPPLLTQEGHFAAHKFIHWLKGRFM
jgi:hypothetical protein